MKTLALICEECGTKIGTIDTTGLYSATLFHIVMLCPNCYRELKDYRFRYESVSK
jgi:hypothetical protein